MTEYCHFKILPARTERYVRAGIVIFHFDISIYNFLSFINMKKNIITATIVIVAILAVVILKYLPGTAGLIWNISQGGTWLLPLVIVAAILDSVHPCSFSILLITIAFLFSVRLSRRRILTIGGIYIAGIFSSYFLIGLGLLQVLHIFNTPHFMGKLGASLLIGFGAINLINSISPKFPIKLQLPAAAHDSMGKLMNVASLPAAFLLGALVGVCQFPCMGGPYLMVIGLLRDYQTYFAGFGYLLMYNLILIVPLVAVLFISANRDLLSKVQDWKRENVGGFRRWSGIAMVIIGVLILFF